MIYKYKYSHPIYIYNIMLDVSKIVKVAIALEVTGTALSLTSVAFPVILPSFSDMIHILRFIKW